MKQITIEDDEAYLRQISEEVSFDDSSLADDIQTLKKYCTELDCFAMAAVQLGIPKRMIYLKNTNMEIANHLQFGIDIEVAKNYDEQRVLINPVVLNREGLTLYWEACASCMNNMGLVKRPYRIEVLYYDPSGEKHVDVFEGFESTVLSHELDHLDGVLHIDKSLEIKVLPAKERAKFRQTHDYEIISKDGDFEKLSQEYKRKLSK
ncbi:MAG: peptide deformylase [Bacilli bacterium]|nr:peptide deformylase [Bacilli bacterium]